MKKEEIENGLTELDGGAVSEISLMGRAEVKEIRTTLSYHSQLTNSPSHQILARQMGDALNTIEFLLNESDGDER